MTAKKILTDVCAIRLILIILLVLYHAFAIFCGGWTPLDGYPRPEGYWWIGKSAYSFMLEAFVFISGYVYGYQIYRNPEKLSLKAVVQSKLKRLILPSIIFSTVYYLLPWAGFAIALVLSFVLTYLTRKTKFGNMLIG